MKTILPKDTAISVLTIGQFMLRHEFQTITGKHNFSKHASIPEVNMQ